MQPMKPKKPVPRPKASPAPARRAPAKTCWLRLDWPLLPGCISQAYGRCGQPGCACKGKPPRLHGPYYRWTGLIAGKATTITLDAAEARECQRRIKRFRALQARVRRWSERGLRRAPWMDRAR